MRHLSCVLMATFAVQAVAVAEENVKVNQALEKLDAALAAEAQRLATVRKPDEAEAVLAIQKAVNDVKPLNGPRARCDELREKWLGQILSGTWDRPTWTNRYVFQAQGGQLAGADVAANGGVVNRGKVTSISSDKILYRWDSGHIWSIYVINKNTLAIEEVQNGKPVNDGILLKRLN